MVQASVLSSPAESKQTSNSSHSLTKVVIDFQMLQTLFLSLSLALSLSHSRSEGRGRVTAPICSR